MAASQRKMILQNLHQETSKIETKTANTLEMIEMTRLVVRQTEELFQEGDIEERVRNPGENYLESQVIKATSEVAVRCSQAISSEVNKYDKFELAEHIKSNHDFWEFTFPLEAPSFGYLHGAFDPVPRIRTPKVRTQRNVQKQQAAPAKVPQKTDDVAATGKDFKMVQKMFRELKTVCKDTPMCYFQAVLDPTSFSRSVENIYHLSFMAREGKLAVFLDEESGLPLIRTLSDNKRRKLENSSEKQFIVSFNMKRWKDLIEAFDVREPFFK